MRTAEEWHHTAKYIDVLKKQNPNWVCDCASCEHLRKVQLDAHAQGMRDAAEIADACDDGQVQHNPKQAILAAIKQKENK